METLPVYTPVLRPATLTPTSNWSLGFAGDRVRFNQAALFEVTQFGFREFIFKKLTAWVTGFDPPCTAVNSKLVGVASNACPFETAMMVKNNSESRPIATFERLMMIPPTTCSGESNATRVPDHWRGTILLQIWKGVGCATIPPIMTAQALTAYRLIRLVSFSLILLLGNTVLSSADFTGKVKTVDDGDTIIVLHDGRDEHIRFNGIDAPEKSQPYGRKAKEFTIDATLNKEVTIIDYGKDKYGRTIGDVVLQDGSNLNRQLVKEGLAWWFWKHSQDKSLRDLEDEARDEKRGLWRDRNPIPPWVFRKIQNKQVPDIGDFEPPRKVPPQPQGAPSEGTTGPIIGHRKSHIYNRPGCPSYGKVSEKNAIQFATVEEAEEAGYTIAKNCSR